MNKPSVIYRYDESVSLSDAEDQYIKAALRHYENNLKKTAKMLGMSRTTLYRRMKQTDNQTQNNEERTCQ